MTERKYDGKRAPSELMVIEDLAKNGGLPYNIRGLLVLSQGIKEGRIIMGCMLRNPDMTEGLDDLQSRNEVGIFRYGCSGNEVRGRC